MEKADFLWKVSHKMLNQGDYNSFSDLFSVFQKTIEHLNLKLWIFSGYTLRLEFRKFRILKFWKTLSGGKSAGHTLLLHMLKDSQLLQMVISWLKVFRIIPEFRILRLTFYRKSASKCWIREIIIASLIYFQYFQDYSWIQDMRLTFHRQSASKCWIRATLCTYFHL